MSEQSVLRATTLRWWITLGLFVGGALAGVGCASADPSQSNDARATQASDDDELADDDDDPTGDDRGRRGDDGDDHGSDGDGGGDTNGDDGGGGDGDDGGPTKPPSTFPGCSQTPYTETLPSSASISGVPFSSAKATDYLLGVLGARYPLGKWLVEGGLVSSYAQTAGGSCVDLFLKDKSSAQGVLKSAATVVHECGHFYDLGKTAPPKNTYQIRTDLKFTCSNGDTTSRGGKTFARSLIKTDTHYAKRKACTSTATTGCDMYAPVYLDGSPTDAVFDSGDQGYNYLLEETTQYVNSIATSLAVADQFPGTRVTARDGILTFVWYVERYLALARTKYPSAYDYLSNNECWRQATLTVYDRAQFYLQTTASMTNLGIDDAAIGTLANDPTLTAEIDALRAIECQ